MAGEQGTDGAFEHFLDAISGGPDVVAVGGTIASRSAGAERAAGFSPDAVAGSRRGDVASGFAVAGDGDGR